jgi:hypothetical protein
MKSLMLDRYHYILNGDGSEEIYDYRRDPFEAHNLVGSEKGTQLLLKFREQLEFALTGKRPSRNE